MKVLYFGSVEAPYQHSFWKECSELFEARSVYLYSQQDGHDWKKYNSTNTTYLNYNLSKISACVSFLKEIFSFNPNFVIIGGYKMPLTIICIIAAKITRASIFFWLERPLNSNLIFRIIKKWYLRSLCLLTDGILAIGNDAVTSYSRLHKRIFNFPYSIDTSKFLKKEKSTNKRLKFIYLGQLIYRKGVIEAVKGFMLHESYDISLTIVGGGALEEEIKSLIKDDKRISQLTYAEYDAIPQILNNHDVLIFPSRHDGWALTLIEAMCSGLFIMGTSQTSAFNEYIINKRNGIKTLANEVDIHNKISWCLDNIDNVRDEGIRNHNLIKNSLSNTKLSALELKRILGLYQKDL